MDEIDKIVQIFQSGEYQLAIQLANGIGMSDMDLLIYIWENESEYYDNNPDEIEDYSTVQRCHLGEFELTKEYNTGEDYYEWFLTEKDTDSYYSTLHNALTCILHIIELDERRRKDNTDI